jgi:hypothetical protein
MAIGRENPSTQIDLFGFVTCTVIPKLSGFFSDTPDTLLSRADLARQVPVFHDLVHSRRYSVWRLFPHSVITALNDKLFTSRGPNWDMPRVDSALRH